MAYQKPAALLSPVTLGDLELKNRVVMAPLTRGRCDEQDGVVGAIHAQYYAQRASCGLVISEATSISKQAHGWPGAPGIYTPEQVAGWRTVTEAVHTKGGKIFLQVSLSSVSGNGFTHKLVPEATDWFGFHAPVSVSLFVFSSSGTWAASRTLRFTDSRP